MILRTADEFLTLLELGNSYFHDVNLDLLIRNVHSFAAEVWLTPRLADFADHGINHSYEDLKKAIALLGFLENQGHPNERLSDLERAALCVGALVHDIGMQWNKYTPDSARLPDSAVREGHVSNGAAMFDQAVRGTGDIQGLPALGLQLTSKWIASIGGKVGFAHSGMHMWTQIVQGPWDEGMQGMPLRPKMLAAAFRLADEIDNAHTRIQNLERLFGEGTLADDTAAHWAACHYIHDVRVVPSAGGVIVEIVPRMPDTSTKDDVRVVGVLIEELRLQRIEAERARTEPYLRPNEAMECSSVRIRLASGPKSFVGERVPESVKRFVSRKFGSTSVDTTSKGESTDIRVISGLNDGLTAASQQLDAANLHGNVYHIGHVALRTGWHSNRYYRCERLLSDAAFLRPLIEGLVDLYQNDGVTDVVGIGTAGIRLGSPLAIRLSSRFHFTFSTADPQQHMIPEVEPASRKNRSSTPYPAYEIAYHLPDNARVIVVDDIVGMGSAVREVLGELGRSHPHHSLVRIFCLLSLGTERAPLDSLAGQIDVLVSDGSTQYWREAADGYCVVCRRQPTMLQREDG